ncbi:MAG: hypothetical protein HKO56_08365, partial [Bacteroidia bacterium]|nr:hypothetical protein [Bacteroidia bacterium]
MRTSYPTTESFAQNTMTKWLTKIVAVLVFVLISNFSNAQSSSDLRIIGVNPTADLVAIQNTGATAVDVSGYNLCSQFNYTTIGALPINSGGPLLLPPGGIISVSWTTAGAMPPAGGELGLYTPGAAPANFANSDSIIHYVQWFTTGNPREGVAVAAGIWGTGQTLPNLGFEYYNLAGLRTGSADWSLGCSVGVTETHVDASCAGVSDGSIDITPSGGIPLYQYGWTHGPTTEDVSGLAAGPYTAFVADAIGCTSSISVTITEPAAITLTCAETSPATCAAADGSANVSAAGGDGGPYTYLWNNSSTNATISGVVAGVYVVTVSDGSGCTSTCSATITQNNVMTGTVSGTSTDATCTAADGSATADVSLAGGTGPYTYAWSDGQSLQTATGLVAGPYTVIVSDISGCTDEVNVTVTAANPVTISCTPADATCAAADGTINTVVAGDAGGLSYAWSDGSSMPNLMNVVAGTYTVTVTDANGCTATCSATIGSTNPMTANITGFVDETCGGVTGSATVATAGDAGGLSYAWSDGQSTATATNLSAGTYTVT